MEAERALIVIDATGDGRDDLLDYDESSLDLVTLGDLEPQSRLIPASVKSLAKPGPGQRFGLGDFTGDGRTDLLIHDAKTSMVSIAQFDKTGLIRSKTVVASDWPATHTWSRGHDYDGDGRDDLLVSDPAGLVMLVRFTSEGGLRDVRVLSNVDGSETLRYAGYFMRTGRASYVSHVRQRDVISHNWFEIIGGEITAHPGEKPVVLVANVKDGSLIVVGNFLKGR